VPQLHAVIHFLVFKSTNGVSNITDVVQYADSKNKMFTAIRSDWAIVMLKGLGISEIL
jgi:hypothetical protein